MKKKSPKSAREKRGRTVNAPNHEKKKKTSDPRRRSGGERRDECKEGKGDSKNVGKQT